LVIKALMMFSGLSWSGVGGPPINFSPSLFSKACWKQGIRMCCRIYKIKSLSVQLIPHSMQHKTCDLHSQIQISTAKSNVTQIKFQIAVLSLLPNFDLLWPSDLGSMSGHERCPQI
jgi:hypothetical protein